MTESAKIYYGPAGIHGPYVAKAEPSPGCMNRRLAVSDIAHEIGILEALEFAPPPVPPMDREQLEDFTKIVEWGRWSWEGMGDGEHPLYLVSTCRKSSAQISDDEAIELDLLVAKLEPRQRAVVEILYRDRKPLMLAAKYFHMDRQTMRDLRLAALQAIFDGLIRIRRATAKTA